MLILIPIDAIRYIFTILKKIKKSIMTSVCCGLKNAKYEERQTQTRYLSFCRNLVLNQIFESLYLDLHLIRRDLVSETFRNKFSYLNHFIITSRYKLS